MTLANIIGTLGHALLLSAIILRLLSPIKLSDLSRLLAVAICIAMVLVPIDEMSSAQISRGIFGDISITSVIVLGRYLLQPQASPIETRQVLILVVVTGLIFYPAALGIGMIDPYQWGYMSAYQSIQAPVMMLIGLVLMMLLSIKIHNSLMLLCITTALAGFMLGVMESNNIWDYLFDPVLFIYGFFSLCFYLIKQSIGSYRGKRHKLT